MRGDLLRFWEADEAIDAAQRARWLAAARRIGTGLRELAHLAATIDEERQLIAFSCEDDLPLAARWAQAIGSERIEGRVIIDDRGMAGVALPCRPDFTDEEIRHVVLACVKAAHVDARPVTAEVVAQLESLRLAEAVVGDVTARLRGFGSGMRQGMGVFARRFPSPPGRHPEGTRPTAVRRGERGGSTTPYQELVCDT